MVVVTTAVYLSCRVASIRLSVCVCSMLFLIFCPVKSDSPQQYDSSCTDQTIVIISFPIVPLADDDIESENRRALDFLLWAFFGCVLLD